MKAILDGDILAYRAAFWADSEGSDWLESRIVDDLKRWTPPLCTDVYVALSCRREDNFRRDYLPAYKAHRNDRPSPENLPLALEILKDMCKILVIPRLEADDIIGMEQSSLRMVGVTIDKDLKQIPGYSYYPNITAEETTSEVQYTDVATADWWFHRQWITGDSTDNIGGLWKLGPKKAEELLNSTSSRNHTPLVLSLYERRKNKEGLSYTYEDALAMARAVRILRDGEYSLPWEP